MRFSKARMITMMLKTQHQRKTANIAFSEVTKSAFYSIMFSMILVMNVSTESKSRRYLSLSLSIMRLVKIVSEITSSRNTEEIVKTCNFRKQFSETWIIATMMKIQHQRRLRILLFLCWWKRRCNWSDLSFSSERVYKIKMKKIYFTIIIALKFRAHEFRWRNWKII